MTKATTTATVEAYMDILKNKGDVETFLNECFGTGEDFDNVACDAFADLVQPEVEAYLLAAIAAAEEATPDMMPQDEVTVETEVNGTYEAVESSIDAPVKGE